MRYWAYFAAKLIAVSAVLFISLALLNPLVPPDSTAATRGAHSPADPPHPKILPQTFKVDPNPVIQVEIAPPSGKENAVLPTMASDKDDQERAHALRPLKYGDRYLAINLALMGWFVAGAVLVYLIVYDQRYRCRVCLRRLRMPVETGSRGFMLQLGRPRIEYICPYGHGTLKQEEFQTSGLENPEWTSHSGDMWEELYAASKQARDEE
jgi:hypothetical protein